MEITSISQQMLKELTVQFGFSIDGLAKEIGVSARTIHRLRRGNRASLKTESNLIRLYCLCTLEGQGENM